MGKYTKKIKLFRTQNPLSHCDWPLSEYSVLLNWKIKFFMQQCGRVFKKAKNYCRQMIKLMS